MKKLGAINRRDLLVGATAALAGAGASTAAGATETHIHPSARSSKVSVAPGDIINLGIVGVAGRGTSHLHWFGQHPDVRFVAVCDVYEEHRNAAAAYITSKTGAPKLYSDFRRMMEDKDVDAVIVSTPPHWHPLVTLAALEAGKDVYCEKPMCRYPNEGRAMLELALRHRRVTQVGTQIHATANYHKCVDVVRSGKLGAITAVRNFCTMDDNSEGLDHPPNATPLEGLDWNFWLGPAPEVPFNMGRFRDGMHRYFKDYVDSWLHELGPHIVDLPFWALKLGHPLAVSASGGRFATDSIADVPDTLDVLWEYPEFNVTWTLMQQNAYYFGVGGAGGGRRLGITFHGKERTLVANYDLCDVFDKNGAPVTDTYAKSVPDSPGHEREFLNAIKSREECSCSFRRHLPMHVAMNLAHSSYRLGRKLHWDAEKWEVTGDREATQLLTPPYRPPWKLPAA
ncbi:MAG: Gfo/Idh/MocA family oxidoreductase [Armatimonadetes bacterium]|nr:Gfo/Idh/MocA family oxidoreductase [Armatimonadota bacterium]MDE2207210.1 Gfo/Idh/MocA family oxidoreductase [Armatimonadota bacterium]